MFLMKLFNRNYFAQNIKKSAPTLALFLGVFPFLNVVIFLLLANANPSGIVATLDSLSILLLVGMYIIPVVLATVLYSFMFKRKSIDFIGSMPISKKSIYITNTLGGFFIIFCVLLITIILMGIVSLFLSNVYMTFPLLVDLFVVFLVAYFFVYASVTLAYSLTGNMLTGLVVTLLFLFFIPYVCYYKDSLVQYTGSMSYIKCTSEDCKPPHYTCEEYSYTCVNHKKENEYQFHLYSNYEKKQNPLPVLTIFGIFGMQQIGTFVTFDFLQLGVTFAITMLYFLIGYFVYKKRKLEVCETSFSNFYIHLLVKALTMLPIFTVLYEINNSESIYVSIFLLILLFIYYFVYDLITRKHIEQIKKSIVSFFVTVVVLFGFCSFFHHLPKKEAPVFEREEMSEIEVFLYNEDKGEMETYYVKERGTIDKLLKYMLNDKKEHDYNIEISFSVGKRGYKTNILLDKEEYQDVLQSLPNQKKVEEKNIDKTYALSIYGDFIKNMEWYKKEVSTFIKEKGDMPSTCYTDAMLVFYQYKNHQVQKIEIPACVRTEIEKKIMEDSNRYFVKYLKQYAHISYFELITAIEEIEYGEMSFFSDYFQEEIIDFFLKHIDKEVTLNDNLISFYLGKYDGYNLRVYLNARDEFLDLIHTLRKRAQDMEEYKAYKKDVRGETIE